MLCEQWQIREVYHDFLMNLELGLVHSRSEELADILGFNNANAHRDLQN